MKGKTIFLFAWIWGIACLLSGCRLIALPGQEPFGEQTYAEDRGQAVYENVRENMEEVEFSDWNGYTMEFNENTIHYNFYRTEEYTAAWHEGAQNYLWYQGQLYCMDGDSLSFRDLKWTKLQADDYAARQWKFARSLLAQEAENIEYKYIPMSSGNPYLLTVEYPETEWDDQLKRFPKLGFQLNEDGDFSGFTLRWQEGSRSIAVSYFPYENSSSLQAERKIWSFAHELGLIEEAVPALSTQQEQREWCQSIIRGIDFDDILDQAERRNELSFPVLSKR